MASSSSTTVTEAPTPSSSAAVQQLTLLRELSKEQLAEPTIQPVNLRNPTKWIDEYLNPRAESYALCVQFAKHMGKAKTAREWVQLSLLHQVPNDQYNSKIIGVANRLHVNTAPYQIYYIDGSSPLTYYMTNHSKPTNVKIPATRHQRLYGEGDGTSGEDEDEEEEKGWQKMPPPKQRWEPQPKTAPTRPVAVKSGRPSPFQPVQSPSPPPQPPPPIEQKNPRLPLREWDETKVSSELYLAFPFLHDNREFIAHMLSQRITGADLCMDSINNADKLGVLLGLDEMTDFKGSKYNILCERIWARVQQWK